MSEPKLNLKNKSIPWNKGKTMSDYPHCGFQKGNKLAHKRKRINWEDLERGRINSHLKIKTQGAWNKGLKMPQISGENHPMYGRKHTPEAIEKMSKTWFKRNDGLSLRERILSCSKNKTWRLSVYRRDKFTCVACGKKGCRDLNAHHLKPFYLILEENKITNLEDALLCEELWDIENGITLCHQCHEKTDTYGGKTKPKN
jgi:hypothetical protein